MYSTTLEDRVILVLREAGEIYGMWKRLEDDTGIAAARWRKAHTSQQRPTPDMTRASDWLAVEYLKMSLSLREALALRGKTNVNDQGERLLAFGLQRVKRNWWASSLAAVAAELTTDPAYKELKKVRDLRESARDQASSNRPPPSGGRSVERIDPTTKQMEEKDLFWSRPAS